MSERERLTTSAAVIPMNPAGEPPRRADDASPEANAPAEWMRPVVAVRTFGLPRTNLYMLARAGHIVIKSVSRRCSLVDANSVRRFLASRPDA